MKLLIGMTVLLFLGGCAQVSTLKEGAHQKLIKANDAKLGLAVEYVCNGASVGAVRRLYKGDFNTWARACPHLMPSLPTLK